MKTMFWGISVPDFMIALVQPQGNVQAAGRRSSFPGVLFQIDPDQKTAAVSQALAAEMVRCDRTDFKAMRDAIRGAGQPVTFVFDVWNLADAEWNGAQVKLWEETMQAAAQTIVLSPRLWSGEWLVHPGIANLPAERTALFGRYFNVVRSVRERLLNLRSRITVLETAPAYEFLCYLSGREELSPLRRLATAAWPRDCFHAKPAFARFREILPALAEAARAKDESHPASGFVRALPASMRFPADCPWSSGLGEVFGRPLYERRPILPVSWQGYASGNGRWDLLHWLFFLGQLESARDEAPVPLHRAARDALFQAHPRS